MADELTSPIIVEPIKRQRLSVFIFLILGISLLSFGPLMVRLSGVGSSASAFWRLSLAVPALLLIVGTTGDRPLTLRFPLLAAMAGAGCLYGLGTLVMSASAIDTTLANCALIGNFSSFFVAGIALASERRWPGRPVLAALLLSAVGLFLVLGRSVAISRETADGDLLALLAALLFTGYFLVIMRLPSAAKPMTVHAVSTTAGALIVAPFALSGPPVLPHWWPIFMLAAAQVGGQGLVVYAMPRISPVLGGLCILLFPLVNMAIGWILYDEKLGGTQLAGAILIVLALGLLQFRNNDGIQE